MENVRVLFIAEESVKKGIGKFINIIASMQIVLIFKCVFCDRERWRIVYNKIKRIVVTLFIPSSLRFRSFERYNFYEMTGVAKRISGNQIRTEMCYFSKNNQMSENLFEKHHKMINWIPKWISCFFAILRLQKSCCFLSTVDSFWNRVGSFYDHFDSVFDPFDCFWKNNPFQFEFDF